MKILYDHQIFTSQKYGGISRYFFELIKEFDKIEAIQTKVSLLFSNNHYISNKKYVQHMNFFPHKDFKGKQRLISLVNKQNTILEIRKQNFNLFHPTYYDTYFLNDLKNKPFVLTVHDMIHEKFKDMFSENDATSSNKKILCEKAIKIIAISQSTKKDLVQFFGINESKLEVVYHGNSMVLDDKVVISIDVPKRYILFVGSRDSYKNFHRFIRSISSLLSKNLDLSVVCVGGGKFKNNEIDLFKKLNIENKVFQYNVDDNLLSQFYAKALMFVFPSLYEGFGIPILESFACHCPLVCSNTSSFPEIARDGAQYFDPYNEESIYSAIKIVLENNEKRELLIKNGLQRLKYFSWEETAKQTKKVYDMVAK